MRSGSRGRGCPRDSHSDDDRRGENARRSDRPLRRDSRDRGERTRRRDRPLSPHGGAQRQDSPQRNASRSRSAQPRRRERPPAGQGDSDCDRRQRSDSRGAGTRRRRAGGRSPQYRNSRSPSRRRGNADSVWEGRSRRDRRRSRSRRPEPPANGRRRESKWDETGPTPAPPPVMSYAAKEIIVDGKLVKFLLGNNGETISKIQMHTGATINVDRSMDATKGYAICKMHGHPEAVAAADRSIRLKLAGFSDDIEVPDGCIVEEREMPDYVIKCVMGPGGCNLKEIQQETGVEIQIKKDGTGSWMRTEKGNGIMRVAGTQAAVFKAKKIMETKIGVWDDFQVWQKSMARLYGTGGATIKELNAHAGVTIRVDKRNESEGFRIGIIRIKDPGTPGNMEARRLCGEILPNVDFSPGQELPKTLDELAPILPRQEIQRSFNETAGIMAMNQDNTAQTQPQAQPQTQPAPSPAAPMRPGFVNQNVPASAFPNVPRPLGNIAIAPLISRPPSDKYRSFSEMSTEKTMNWQKPDAATQPSFISAQQAIAKIAGFRSELAAAATAASNATFHTSAASNAVSNVPFHSSPVANPPISNVEAGGVNNVPENPPTNDVANVQWEAANVNNGTAHQWGTDAANVNDGTAQQWGCGNVNDGTAQQWGCGNAWPNPAGNVDAGNVPNVDGGNAWPNPAGAVDGTNVWPTNNSETDEAQASSATWNEEGGAVQPDNNEEAEVAETNETTEPDPNEALSSYYGNLAENPELASAIYEALALQAQSVAPFSLGVVEAQIQEATGPNAQGGYDDVMKAQVANYHMGARYEGIIKSYVEEKTWGFIHCNALVSVLPPGRGIFFHKKDCNYTLAQTGLLKKGFPVTFSCHTDPSGKLHAKSVMPA